MGEDLVRHLFRLAEGLDFRYANLEFRSSHLSTI